MGSYSIDQLYHFTPDVASRQTDQANPLIESDSLNEAELVDIRLSAQRGRVGLLLDLRGALGFPEYNTALAVLTGVASVDWSDDGGRQLGSTDWKARWGDWEPRFSDGAYTLRTAGGTHAATIVAARAELYLGNVDALGDGPIPDFTTDSVADIIAGFPQWSSTMLVAEHHQYPGRPD
ncbi:hypothetical protein PT015_03415 [Candidatus Mycobacterium wuenschmannii]|uniref:Uncharacterized protein n=1 Tax=Candidatus Mycobacterium wuenschmannii TaxID=3027808 RepID=A0ABY8W0N0_9MYCO|nr:hypothetical protein [Candidatus Mycobacterium wuenschmannii]WIM88559.1 hypothetical protein PT015_03415 [Candidatus Mycobacterium wuenschmannii]